MPATAKKAPEKLFNFGDESVYVSGGFSIPEGDYCWKEVNVLMFSGEKKDGTKAGPDRLGVVITLCPLTDPANEQTQFYSFGSKAHESFAPSENGKGMVPIPGGKGASLYKNTNWDILYKSLRDSGLPPGTFEGDVSVFEGMHVHMVPVPEPEERKTFRSATGEASGQQQERKIAIVTEIKDEGKPWEGSGGIPEASAKPVQKQAKSPAKATQPEPAAVEESEENDIQSVAESAFTDVLSALPKGGPKLQIRTSVFKAIKDKSVANQVVNAYFKDDSSLNSLLEPLGYKVQGSNITPA